MKKLALLAVILLMFGLTVGFAEATVDVSGEAEVTFGYNLDDGGAGFENSEDISFIVSLVPETTVASDMMSGWHGYIEFADFSVVYDQDGLYFYEASFPIFGEDTDGDQDVELLFDDFDDYYGLPVIYVTEPDVTAKITNGTIYVTIYGGPGFEDVDLVTPIEDDTDVSDPGDADWKSEDEEGENDIDQGFHEGAGITVGYDSDMFDVEVYIADYDGYSDSAPTEDFADDWLFGAKVSVSAAGAELTAAIGKAIMGSYAEPVGDEDFDALYIGASASYTLDAGMMSVVPYAGIDAYQNDNVDFTYEFGGGVDCTFTNEDTVGIHAFYSPEARGGEMSDGFDVELVLAENAEAGFVPGLGVDFLFGYYDLGTDVGDPDMLVTTDVSYMFGDFTPFVGFDYDKVDADTDMLIDAGIKFTGIPMTTILVQWNSGDLDAETMGYIEVQATVAM